MLQGTWQALVMVLILSPFLAPGSWAAESLAAAVLPSSRSVQVGTPATAFAVLINLGLRNAIGCGIAPSKPLGKASFTFQTTSPATNAVTGTPNTIVNIPPGAAQTFVFAFTPSGPISSTEVALRFECANTNPAPSISGLNTLHLVADARPVPDIVALTATTGNNGIVDIHGTIGSGAFAVGVANVGAGGRITASADTGKAKLPVSLSLCETNPATGVCLEPPDKTVTTGIDAGATATFAIFIMASGEVPFDPAMNRIFVRFRASGKVDRGATSVAVQTLLH